MEEQPISVWNEVRVSGDGIGITLYSESAGSTPIVQDETWFSFDELQSEMVGEILSLNLSDETREAMVADLSDESPYLPEEGQILRDENAPSWSDDDRVEVVKVMPNVRADEWSIEDGEVLDNELRKSWERTVADANPSYDADEPVVIGRYWMGSSKVYAFPLARLRPE